MAREESQAKMGYYPTEFSETLKIFSLLSGIHINLTNKSNYLTEAISRYSEDYTSTPLGKAQYLFISCVEQGMPLDDILKSFRIFQHTQTQIVVADFFAGEGKWLSLFKHFISNTITVANEIEENRAKCCSSSPDIDYAYHGAYEELVFPSKVVDIMLFNPPYDTINKVSCAKWYLQDIVRKDYISQNGIIICVLQQQDYLQCKECLVDNFEIYHMYKVHAEEFQKWGQYIVIAKKRPQALSAKSTTMADLPRRIVQFEQRLESATDSFPAYSDNLLAGLTPCSDFSTILGMYKVGHSIPNKISSLESSLWHQIMQLTSVSKMDQSTLVLPKKPKPGELAQIIAAGYINGPVCNHVTTGGIKKVETTCIKQDDKGNDCLSSIRANIPYLSVLYRDGTGFKQKELLKAGSVEIKEDNVTEKDTNNEKEGDN